jgi:DNA-binding CsgD family transcriptional regulator/tetratricopeptide (TPR) repeat protein
MMRERAAVADLEWSAPGELIGRRAELAQIERLLETARRGRSDGLFVFGDPGVGKTRLLDETVAMASQRDLRVARAMCLPLTTPLPLDPALELLRALGEPVRSLVDDSRRDVFGIVLEGLERAVVGGPMLLCLDDLQWSDSATVDLVHYCLARLRDLPIAWVLMTRPDRTQARLAHRLERDGLIRPLQLGALTVQETALLTQSALGSREPDEGLAKVVYERTGGNPFLSVELLRAVARSGPGLNTGGDPLSRSSPVAAAVPATVSDAIEDRACRLSPGAQVALEWAAILPEPFTPNELERVGGRRIGSALEELADAAFLIRDGQGGWRIVHSITRDAIYQRLPERERIRRHGVVADALAHGPLERVAPQLASAHRWAEAADAFMRLGGAALDRGEGEDAARLYERSHELAVRGGDQRARRDAQAGRVLALLRLGSEDEAKRDADTLRAELRLSGEPSERLSFLSRYAQALLFARDAADLEAAQEVLDEAVPLSDEGDQAARAELLIARATVALQAADSAPAVEAAERAVSLAREVGDAGLEARALSALGEIVGRTRTAAEAMHIKQLALARAQQSGLPAVIAYAHACLGVLGESTGDIPAAQAHILRALEVEGAPPWVTALLQSNLGVTFADLGDLDSALAHQLAALRPAARAAPRIRTRVAIALTQTHLWRGELRSARRLLESIQPLSGSLEEYRAKEQWAKLLAEEGAVAQALIHYQEGAALLDPGALWCATGAARVSVALGDLSTARAALVRLDDLVARWPVGEWMREEARGWVAVGERDPNRAAGHFRAAAARSSEAYTAVLLRLEAARLTHDREEVRAAIEAFERMGAKRAADRARAVARELGMRPGRRRTPTGALSAREQAVAQLVAAGQTNAEIAAVLYLSPRTVEHHISNILTKLGYRSRVQIASAAAAGRLPG